MEKADRVLKQDARGRVWTLAERREAVLDEFEKSGLLITEVPSITPEAWAKAQRQPSQLKAAS